MKIHVGLSMMPPINNGAENCVRPVYDPRASQTNYSGFIIHIFSLNKPAANEISCCFHKIISQTQIKFAFVDKKPVHLLPKIK